MREIKPFGGDIAPEAIGHNGKGGSTRQSALQIREDDPQQKWIMNPCVAWRPRPSLISHLECRFSGSIPETGSTGRNFTHRRATMCAQWTHRKRPFIEFAQCRRVNRAPEPIAFMSSSQDHQSGAPMIKLCRLARADDKLNFRFCCSTDLRCGPHLEGSTAGHDALILSSAVFQQAMREPISGACGEARGSGYSSPSRKGISMRPLLLLPLILMALPMTGCAEPTVSQSADGSIVVHHLSAFDDASSVQDRADAECGKQGLKAHFSRYAEETLLGPRDAYFDCISS
jgi:hypothetical protein